MKTGAVFTIRLNAVDIMSLIDTCQKVGIIVDGMSLSHIMKMGVSILCESARQAQVIPTRDGFEYSDMIKPYKYHDPRAPGVQARKIAITGLSELALVRNDGRIGEHMTVGHMKTPDHVDPQRGRKMVRYEELKLRFEQAPDNMSQEERQEYADLMVELT